MNTELTYSSRPNFSCSQSFN